MKALNFGFSPCPNDTYMFEALVHGRIKSGFRVVESLHDIEQLNSLARHGKLDITKISFSNYPAVSEHYRILTAGAALGKGCGPLLVSKKEYSLQSVKDLRIAIPGKHTTANLLLNMFFPDAKRKMEIIFSDIERAVIEEQADAGLLIHENRFTYADRGLIKIADMGEIWEQTTGTPVPLGCIIIRRDLEPALHAEINGMISKSIRFAFDFPEKVMPYVRIHAQEMDDTVMKRHIELYVNKFSLDLGTEGRKAIEVLFKKGFEFGLLPRVQEPVFVDSFHTQSV